MHSPLFSQLFSHFQKCIITLSCYSVYKLGQQEPWDNILQRIFFWGWRLILLKALDIFVENGSMPPTAMKSFMNFCFKQAI